MNSSLALELSHLSVSYDNGKKKTVALKDINLSVRPGEFISIIGPSGCGKTTLLYTIAGLKESKEGSKSLLGSVNVVFQDPLLLPWRTAEKNIAFGIEVKGLSKKEREGRTNKLLKLVGLSGYGQYFPHQLSGGMRQRVNLARALACEPETLLLDEPFANIDALTREALGDEILSIWQKTQKTFIFVTHQITEALLLSERVIVLSARPGRIVADVKVNLPYPRKTLRFSKEFISKEKYLTRLIEHENKK